jgi:hypothetical protein
MISDWGVDPLIIYYEALFFLSMLHISALMVWVQAPWGLLSLMLFVDDRDTPCAKVVDDGVNDDDTPSRRCCGPSIPWWAF